MYIPRALVATAAILSARDSSLSGSLTNVANAVEGLVVSSVLCQEQRGTHKIHFYLSPNLVRL